MPSFDATVETADVRDKILFLGKTMHTELARALDKIGRDTVAGLRADAPTGRTGATVKGINFRSEQGRRATAGNFSVFDSGGRFVITAVARDKNTGYDYTNVTRFGHQLLYILPVQRKMLAYDGAGKFTGQRFIAPHVKGQNPRRDWARNSLIRANLEAKEQGLEISRKLELVGRS